MSSALKVKLRDANKVKEFLQKNNFLDFSKKLTKDKTHIFFPVNYDFNENSLKNTLSIVYDIVDIDLDEKQDKKNFSDLLRSQFGDEDLLSMKTSYDVVGDIAILEIDKEFRRKEKFIAECLLETNPNVKTVVRKQGSHEGTFRRQKMKYLAGEHKKETLHKENGIQLLLDIEKVYFSARQSTERRRIADQVKDGERVLVLFSGCAPFVCVIAKNSNPKYVCGVELNPIGHKYAMENVRLNKFNNVFLSNRDAKKTNAILKDFRLIPEFEPHFDRIVMPLPKSAEEFLDEALFFSKHGTIIHFYDFLDEKDFHQAHEKIKRACQKNLLKPKILDTVKCGQHSPHVFRICVDFMVY